MPNWGQVLKEIAGTTQPLDMVRRRYLDNLTEKRKRNVIAYYSGWLQKPGLYQTSINDDDKNNFMAVIHGLDRKRGLDLILHTPGGDMAATESLIDYLHKMFDGDIVAVIPQIAMSAGTMIACSCREIIMGKQSNIGPIDPELMGVSAYGVIKEFENAIEEIQRNPSALNVWQMIIGQYRPTFLGECRKAIELSTEIVRTRLETVMFAGERNASAKVKRIVEFLNEHENTKIHARHIDLDQAISCGLKIKRLEEDNDLQDAVLTVHHCYMHTFANSQASKITENHLGNAVVNIARS